MGALLRNIEPIQLRKSHIFEGSFHPGDPENKEFIGLYVADDSESAR